MSRPSQPDLPSSLLREVLAILDSADQSWDEQIERLCEREPQHAGEIRHFLAAARERATTAERALPGSEQGPRQFGPYRLLELIGRGGMGAVYLAEQREPVRRRVALKVIRRDLGFDPRVLQARFEAERAALSRMEHSHIAKVFDAGVHDGQPYFAMEYVKGIPLTRYCDENKLGIDERLRLFLQVCSGVQHAHNKGVIHRDLTPSNVLVSVQDGQPAAKIIDFGLAKGTDGALTDRTVFTQHGAVLGTPAYMSPEQAGLGGLDVDTRSDVYTLGVVLYELLTGSLPFEGVELKASADPYRMIREQDPPAPSTRIVTRQGGAGEPARLRRTEIRTLLERLRSDLDWIVLKCLEKDRTRRYATPSGLAEDIERHLAHEPVLARAPTFAYRASKVVRRHARALVAGGAVLVALCVGLGIALLAWGRLANKIRDFDLLAGVVRLGALVEARKDLYPLTVARLPAVEAWLQDAERVLATRFAVERALADMPSEPTSDAERLLREQLTTFTADLGWFENTIVADVRRNCDWLGTVDQVTLEADRRQRWEDAREAIRHADGVKASALYGAVPIDLVPQRGLVPIGCNPVTKLWEFYDLRSAADRSRVPGHKSGGVIEVTTETGIVFVLLPGAVARIGAQRHDRAAPNHDPHARPLEGPVHEVRLDPFFIARHELTHGQWSRLWLDEDPSHYAVGEPVEGTAEVPNGACPVDQVAQEDIVELLTRHGLRLPTEAQWEYAARGGATSPWCSGPEVERLALYANLADATVAGIDRDGTHDCEPWSDGFAIPAPVGRLAPNAFGLHDVHGNVAEWVCDDYARYDVLANEGDGLRGTENASPQSVVRGGAFLSRATEVRLSARYKESVATRSPAYGVRVVRRLELR